MARISTFDKHLVLYEKLVAAVPNIERKGATMPYTSVNGNMFSFLDKDGVINLRLDQVNRQNFLRKFSAKQSIQHGIVMKEYVAVPDSILASTSELKKWLSLSYEYAKALKPKKSK